ncbi:MAG TPA: restriction endonuclease subunit S [Microcoleaceae bacterium UBA10368]|jgi:Restriction endonuclease S subunits|nr:restriction endonuclease subunit S [Microcoleaceae cyanobacterium UBA10368]
MTNRSDWELVRIKDIGTVKTGRTPPTVVASNFGDEYLFITPSDMDGRKKIYDTERKVSSLGASVLASCQLPANSICVSCIGWQMGKVVMTTQTCFTNQQINTIIPNDKILPDFLYYSLSTRREEFKTLGSVGTRTPILKKSLFENLGIYLPPLPIQRKIAAILSTYDRLIENNTRRIEILEEMARSIYREWFVKFRFPGHEQVQMVDSELGPIPEGWEIKKVNEIVKRLRTGTTYKEASVDEVGCVPVIDQSRSDFLGFHNNKPDHTASSENPIIIFGDHTCKMQLMVENFSLAPNVVPFVSIGNLPITYLYLLVNSLVTTTEYKRHWTEFTNKKVVLATNDSPKQFADFVKTIFEINNSLRKKNRNLRKTRDLLLPRLISGEIDVENLDIKTGETAA